jgi:hypothetical protein
MKWTTGDIQRMTSGHGFHIIEKGRLPIALLSLVYETNADAAEAAELVQEALNKAIDVINPLR